MNTKNYNLESKDNFEKHIKENIYPGRGIIIGINSEGDFIIIYWLMGRSENSRNRILVNQDLELRTEAINPDKIKNPSLIIYSAVKKISNGFLVSNGDHTERILNRLNQKKNFESAISEENHENDPPNFTPRIVGLISFLSKKTEIKFGIIKKSPFSNEFSEYSTFSYNLIKKGFGYGISTYISDGNPLPSFNRSPMLFPLNGDIRDITKNYWEALNRKNKLSIAILKISSKNSFHEWNILNAKTKI